MIRPAAGFDVPGIAWVHVQSWRETYAGLMPQSVLDGLSVEARERQWWRTLEVPTTGVFVVDTPDDVHDVVGFSSVGKARDEGFDAELYTLYVLKPHQGRGLGRRLWDAALGFVRSQGARNLNLWVLETNPARGFYERMGGKLEGRKVESFGGIELAEVSYAFVLERTTCLIGGMSWESSLMYYKVINETVRHRVHPLENARSLMYTVNFHQIERLQHEGRWDEAGRILADAATRLERGGADCVVLCTNTMHKLCQFIEDAVSIPLIHIADATAQRVRAAGMKRVGLLGTGFTMEQDFYKGRLEKNFNLEVIVPGKADRDVVHRVIYDELCAGKVVDSSKQEYVRIMQDLVRNGAEGIILGCTEIMLLVGQADASVPVFDTTTIHAVAAVDFALERDVVRDVVRL